MLYKLMVVFIHLIGASMFVLFSFAVFGEQWWIPNWLGVVIIGIALYILFGIAVMILMEYLDEQGKFDYYDWEEDDNEPLG